MRLSITDDGSGILKKFANAIGAVVHGRFVHIPENKGEGYLTGFNWGNDLRMMIRNFHLKDDIYIDRTNKLAEGTEDVMFMLSGIFPPPGNQPEEMLAEQGNVLICMHKVSATMAMPSNTMFRNMTLAVSRQYLRQLFGAIKHPAVETILNGNDQFVYETGLSAAMIRTGIEMLDQQIPEMIESHFYKIKCEELLCYTFALLLQREASPTSDMHLDDIKAIYAVKSRLQSCLNEPPNIASLARESGIGEPKLRKLFKQTFGKGVFEYYQTARMQEAARLLLQDSLTVSETGYRLGFSNLSHFSRVFEQYIGVKPKKYVMGHRKSP
ncbi:MAG: AraC family transcriptional regulator [Pedobacter sp.]|uniref:helix-turn-helix transcriptional regulator n=1 Tax=Pedobacter sp. TaxID=1411316 RepID=UPI0033938EC3